MRNFISVLLALCLLTGLLSELCLAEDAAVVPEGCIANLSYIEDGDEDHMLDLFIDEAAGEKQPLILEIHGGGFFGGTKETNTAHCQAYADAGFAVAAPNYTHMPEASFKTIVQEVFSFLHWVEDSANDYPYDLEHVFMSGDSAGGYIVLLTAAVLASSELQAYYEVTPPEFSIRGYALTCPVTDLPALVEAYDGDMGFVSFMAGQMGEAVLKDEDTVRHADLFQIIDPATFPEVYFITTPTDSNFYSHSVKLDTFLTENQVQHIYKEYVGTDGDLVHVFNISEPDSPDGKLANDEMIAYLKSLMT